MKSIKLKQDMEKHSMLCKGRTHADGTFYMGHGATIEDCNCEVTNKKCTCKMDEQWNCIIDNKCYWHGK
jgi:hypothetical protein